MLHTLVTMLDEGDACSLVVLIAILGAVGKKASEARPAAVRWATRLAASAFVAYCVSGWVRFSPTHAIELLWIAIRALLASGLALGGSLVLLPVAAFLYEHTLGAARKKADELARSAAQLAAQRQRQRDDEEQQRRAREYRESRPPPVPPDPAAEAKKKSDAVHRANARFEAETLYRAHYPKLQQAFPTPESFAAYLDAYLGKDEDPDVIEQRLKAFRQSLIGLAGGEEPSAVTDEREELKRQLADGKQFIEGLDLSEEAKGSLLLALESDVYERLQQLILGRKTRE